ncbi:hypothetical protein ACW9HW_12105 [Pseudomonas sp. SDO5532_S415]|jgi:E3 ubiquitin-protein ligase DOA10|uniref:hypothetical protein n=1 Tax=Pseudomonas sp. Irchel 3A7 TaxID=2008913 RepID=UPI0014825132|nr:hypothetical protein [Pseudomonas sp. Irchel 3A7]
MQRHDLRRPVIAGGSPAEKPANQQKTEFNISEKPNGEVDMEPRVVELEKHLKCIRRDMEEARSDVSAIKHRLAYSAGGTIVVLSLLGWIANSRFDQLVTLLLAH